MVEETNEFGGNAKLVSLEGFGHNDGIEEAYKNTNLITWLLEQRRECYDYVADYCEDIFWSNQL